MKEDGYELSDKTQKGKDVKEDFWEGEVCVANWESH